MVSRLAFKSMLWREVLTLMALVALVFAVYFVTKRTCCTVMTFADGDRQVVCIIALDRDLEDIEIIP